MLSACVLAAGLLGHMESQQQTATLHYHAVASYVLRVKLETQGAVQHRLPTVRHITTVVECIC
jgi:hypothetical protein